MIELSKMPDHSRVWVYQSNRELSVPEVSGITLNAENFISNWISHNHELKASVGIIYNRFIIVMVDESYEMPGGCAIDKSLHFIRKQEQLFNIQLTNRLLYAYREGEEVKSCSSGEFGKKVASGEITEDTIVFNNLVNNKTELQENWEVPMRLSWHSRYLSVCLILLLFIVSSCNFFGGDEDNSKKSSDSTHKADSITKVVESQKKIKNKATTDKKNQPDSTLKKCYYEPQITELTGVLYVKQYYGPPNYGKTPEIDEKDEQFLLKLDSSINVFPIKGSDMDDIKQFGVERITLIPAKSPTVFKQQEGKTVKVRGKLFGANTPYHHTPVLMQDVEILKSI